MSSTEADVVTTETVNGNWHSVLTVEGVRTSDGREFKAGSLRWRTLPLPLMMQLQTAERHQGSVVVGKITRIERIENELHGWGTFDLGSENGREAQRLVAEQIMRGVSIDAELLEIDREQLLGNEDGEITLLVEEARIGAATIVAFPAFPQAVIALADTDIPASTEDGRAEALPTASEEHIHSLLPHHDEESGVSRGSLYAAVQRFNQLEAPLAFLQHARAHLINHFAEDLKEHPPAILNQRALTAHADVTGPPASWFDNPELKGPTPLTVARNGRIYGHAALWNACHTGYRECMKPPRSNTNYAHFLTGAVFPSDCDCEDALATGPIVLSTTHADGYAEASTARRHYDNTGQAVADVKVGEDEFGIWVAGALRPGLSEKQLRALRGSSLSGDWRWIGGNYELISILAVNTPGFPIPRVAAAFEAGVPVSLVAAGIPNEESDPDLSGTSPADILEELKREREQSGDDNGDEEDKTSDDDSSDTSSDESTDDPATTDDPAVDSTDETNTEPDPSSSASSGLSVTELLAQTKTTA